MGKWIVKPLIVLLVLGVGYLLTVQVLRAIAFGEDERAALAVMTPVPPPPPGQSGYKYLGLQHLEIPLGELDAALATDLAAYDEWLAHRARQTIDSVPEEGYGSPLPGQYPARADMARPEGICGLREPDCLARVRENEATVRDWLAQEAVRLDLAERALASDHLANPYALSGASPIASFGLLALPLNAIALQGAEGDVPGALDRACGLLANNRRFLAQDGQLIDTMTHGALLEGAAGLVLALRREAPELPLPPSCTQALAPVLARDFLACSAFKHEHDMVARYAQRLDKAGRDGFNPLHAIQRWTLTDERLLRAWHAQPLAPLCTEEGQAAILAGRVPEPAPAGETPWLSVDFVAAPVSRILGDIAMPVYHQYQTRLLDDAAVLRLYIAAIAAVGGELEPGEVPVVAASPGYEIRTEDGHWILPRRDPRDPARPELRIAIPQPPEMGSEHISD